MVELAGPVALVCYAVLAVALTFIVLNWIALVAFMAKGSKGNFSFAPPILCGIFGAVASFGAIEQHAAWLAGAFLILDPSIALALGWIAIRKVIRWARATQPPP